MAIKTISQFPSGIPADNDYILFEQNGEGKSTTLASLPVPTSVQSKLDTKVNYSDSLTYEEIMATNPAPDLTNKVSNASALKTVFNAYKTKVVYIYDKMTDLNDCKDIYTCYTWDYTTYKYVTCGGVAISPSAGSVINFPKFIGVLQVFVMYNEPTIKVRTLYNSSWSSWKAITTSSSSL